MDNREKVYAIFKEFFGEDQVDMQGGNILVHFPHVTVTNESGRSTNINHLFAKMQICNNGTLEGTFGLNRTEYTEQEFRAGYVHSHIPRMYYTRENFSEFKHPCLGTGPIKITCLNLNRTFDEDMWRLFCFELSQYVTVESLSGGPYIRMEEVGTIDHFSRANMQPWVEEIFDVPIVTYNVPYIDKVAKMFIPYVIKSREIPFVYSGSKYTIALSPYELAITLSNLFIAWYNTLPDTEKPERILGGETLWKEYKCSQGKILKRNTYYTAGNSTIEDFLGIELFTFKGITYTLTIPDYNSPPETKQEQEGKTSILIVPSLVTSITHSLIEKVNYGITRNKENRAKKGAFASEIGQDVRVL